MNASDYYENTIHRTAGWSAARGGGAVRDVSSELAERMAQLERGGRYLDIGCQSGGLISRVHHLFDETFGIDIGAYTEEWKKMPASKFLVHDVDASPLPFPNEYFRVVTCIMVLEHVFDVFGLVREARRVLRAGGTVMIEVPNIAYFKHILSLLRGRVPRTGAIKYPFTELEGWDGQHLHQFTINEMKWLLEHVGFQVEDVFSRGRWQGLRRCWPNLLNASIVMVATAK